MHSELEIAFNEIERYVQKERYRRDKKSYLMHIIKGRIPCYLGILDEIHQKYSYDIHYVEIIKIQLERLLDSIEREFARILRLPEGPIYKFVWKSPAEYEAFRDACINEGIFECVQSDFKNVFIGDWEEPKFKFKWLVRGPNNEIWPAHILLLLQIETVRKVSDNLQFQREERRWNIQKIS